MRAETHAGNVVLSSSIARSCSESGIQPTPVPWFEYSLYPSERRALEEALIDAPSPHEDLDCHLDHVEARLPALLPAPVRRAIRALRTDPVAPAILVLHGLPVDVGVVPAPADGQRAAKRTFVTEALLLGLGGLLGAPFAFRAEKQGEIVHNVVPTSRGLSTPTNEGVVHLDLHTEVAFREDRPDFLGLSCLRDGAARAETLFSDTRSASALLDEATLDILRRPLFRIRTSKSFVLSGSTDELSTPVPVLSGPPERPILRVNLASGTVGITAEAEAALGELAGGLRACSRALSLRPGDLVLFDNRTVAHGRRAFPARPEDVRRRWLQRAYFSLDLAHHPSARERVW